MKGFVLYDGPSEIDGEPILALTVLSAGNGKTASPALWVLPKAEPEVGPNGKPKFFGQTRAAGRSVCGGCPFFEVTDEKGRKGTACFAWAHALPIAGVVKSYHAGNYVLDEDMDLLQAWVKATAPRRFRDAYIGDPSAVPREVLEPALHAVLNHAGGLGYCHHWRDPRNLWLRDHCMASVETEQDAALAHSMGWRTFRTGLKGEQPAPGEVHCPSQTDGTTCAACGLCDGAGQKPSIFATIHGVKHVVQRAERVILAARSRAAKRATTNNAAAAAK